MENNSEYIINEAFIIKGPILTKCHFVKIITSKVMVILINHQAFGIINCDTKKNK